jgi:alanine racemase
MPIAYNEIRVRIRLQRIVDNYTLLAGLAPGAVPVIKADAYGHGLERVGAALAAAGAAALAVGTIGEAVKLRKSGFSGRILALLGFLTKDEAKAILAHDLMPFVGRYEQLELLGALAARKDRRVDIVVKCDTGMRRLGFDRQDGVRLAQALRSQPTLRPVLLASHLATADDPEAKDFVLEQNARFAALREQLQQALGVKILGSLANSAAVLAYPELHYEAPRPGIALYGANPFHGTPLAMRGRDLFPAMEVHAPVLQVHELRKGETISYGRTFAAPRDMRVAIVAAGYADAYCRGLSSPSGQGPCMLLAGARRPVLGRVCMQMTAVDVTEPAKQAEPKPGDRAYLLGGPGPLSITPEELAAWWGTIPYEVFCLLGCNPKEYEA